MCTYVWIKYCALRAGMGMSYKHTFLIWAVPTNDFYLCCEFGNFLMYADYCTRKSTRHATALSLFWSTCVWKAFQLWETLTLVESNISTVMTPVIFYNSSRIKQELKLVNMELFRCFHTTTINTQNSVTSTRIPFTWWPESLIQTKPRKLHQSHCHSSQFTATVVN